MTARPRNHRRRPVDVPLHTPPRRRFPAGRAAAGIPSVLLAVMLCALPRAHAHAGAGASGALTRTIEAVQPKIVKIYGAGGISGLEAYQTGLLVSAEGHVLTVLSPVLDTDQVTVILGDGRRFTSEMVGADPRLEIAILKISASDLPHFKLADAVAGETATRVLAFSNLFGVATGNEAASVMHGWITVQTPLRAQRGSRRTPYQGPVYVLDAITNNPGAAGGALTTFDGRLLGMLGKELRSELDNTWLNYALPAGELIQSIGDIIAGELQPPDTADRNRPAQPTSLRDLGMVLVPDVLPRTPPFIDYVQAGSHADIAGLQPDDLVVLIGDRLVQSSADLRDRLEWIPLGEPVPLTVLRGETLVPVNLTASSPENNE